ncbi:MAG: hypothetical protein IKU29_02255, partial [Parabacteroides sp.]|nr:hypothetical protein [Parabacteroides sp.]
NIAGDHECNITLAKVPDGMGLFSLDTMKKMKAYVDEKYSTWSFEAIYKDIPGQTKDTMDNSSQSAMASKAQDYVNGWNQAMKDYKDGKLKI